MNSIQKKLVKKLKDLQKKFNYLMIRKNKYKLMMDQFIYLTKNLDILYKINGNIMKEKNRKKNIFISLNTLLKIVIRKNK